MNKQLLSGSRLLVCLLIGAALAFSQNGPITTTAGGFSTDWLGAVKLIAVSLTALIGLSILLEHEHAVAVRVVCMIIGAAIAIGAQIYTAWIGGLA